MNNIIYFTTLFVFWLILSEKYDAFHIIYGIITVIAVMLINKKLFEYKFFPNSKSDKKLNFISFLLYIPWLFVQIIISSIQVAKVVVLPSKKPHTSLLKFKVNLPNETAKVFLGNSITLTPGTLTISIEGNEFIVHALTDASAQGIIDQSLPKKVAGLFDKNISEVVTEMKIIDKPES